ncbi:hypothetical protein [Streptomyces sp. NPDC052036]|uniref:hypothetical protein n=1 Tax=Streptomyces sp. NPDC052036 TaxID=3155171 RepID=UPI0034475BFA
MRTTARGLRRQGVRRMPPGQALAAVAHKVRVSWWATAAEGAEVAGLTAERRFRQSAVTIGSGSAVAELR